jgi:hypothetical protein
MTREMRLLEAVQWNCQFRCHRLLIGSQRRKGWLDSAQYLPKQASKQLEAEEHDAGFDKRVQGTSSTRSGKMKEAVDNTSPEFTKHSQLS